MDKQTSDFSLSRVECPKCGATWLNGQHYWRTGARGDEETLSNLVCSTVDSPECINDKYVKGKIYPNKDTWKKRSDFINTELKKRLDEWQEEF
jgi:hypothetical protein